MNIGNHSTSYHIDETKIENVKEIKFFGITIEKKLNFNKHTHRLKNSYIPNISFLYMLKETYKINQKKLLQLYKSRLRSKID